MYVANTHLKPVIGIDIHFVEIPFPFPLPHPYIGLVIDPFDYIPFIGATVKINHVPRGNTDTMGMIITFQHIPEGAGFTLFPIIGHDSQNFFGSKTVSIDGAPMSGAGHLLMTCNDIGLPLSFRPRQKIHTYSIVIPANFLLHTASMGQTCSGRRAAGTQFQPDVFIKSICFWLLLKSIGKSRG